MRTLRLKNKKGMTGIETAIIVIAFVIAASVFAFAILNMGLLTTNKAQEAITSGVGSAQSAMKITSVYALGNGAATTSVANGIVVIVQPSGTGSTDFNLGKVSVSYKNDNVAYANVYTVANFVNSSTFQSSYSSSFSSYAQGVGTNKTAVLELQGNANQLLEQGEAFAVFLNLTNIDNTNGPIGAYKNFAVEIIPSQGAKLTFSTSMPSAITPVMILTGA